jgi:hypothetical protein
MSEWDGNRGPGPSDPPEEYGIGASVMDQRVKQLEVENLRLQRLVAELLLKNQQLRTAAQA